MSDFPLDEDLNTPPISPAASESTLDVLLNPLSPDLTPTQLTFNLHRSSGHIPFVLYDDDYMDLEAEPLELQGFSISDFSLASVNASGHASRFRSASLSRNGSDIQQRSSIGHSGSERRSSTATTSSTISADSANGTSSSSRTTVAESLYLGLNTLESSNTISSVGTFGPKHKRHQQSIQPDHDVVEGSPPLPDSPSLSQQFPNSVSLSRGSIGTGSDQSTIGRKRSSIVASRDLSAMFASPTVFSDGHSKRASLVARMDSSEPDSFSAEHSVPREDISALKLASDSESQTDTSFAVDAQDDSDGSESDSTTPKKPIPKNISWISTRDWDYKQYKEYIAKVEGLEGGLPRSPSPVSHVQDVGNTTVSPRKRTPPRLNVLPMEHHRDLDVIVETPRASLFAREIYDHRPEALSQGQTSPSAAQKNSLRQDEHNWLKEVTVQFLIDQEGFRAAHPSFKFGGVARIRPSQNSKAPLIVMAQFRPVARQAFHFHHAPFESPPILRRVTVNFDETHDYLSRQALLTLKNNGVYVLHGHEISHTSPELESSKLFWQFEYLIDDRRVETSGRVMEGEKIMTPLTFSCTPALLLPGQGKRNSIMHVFKKGVAPKLVAERLQPPGLSTAPKKTSDDPQTAETDGHMTFFSSKAHAWNLHRRGQSHAVHTQKHTERTSRTTHEESENIEPISPSHRRAVSGGDGHKPAGVVPRFDALTSPSKRTQASPFVGVPAPARHIIPPQKLAELLDASGSPERPPAHRPPSIRNSNQFVPLTPRPRQPNSGRDLAHIR
ncbi:hypothetical protein JR316_0000291 [Psilocybe cubensis]|uniref:Uncharacterized protein n=2 Tax=Psilocybe cubensis TaxID=181762 RepID=A0A8H8CQ68_PSICU|nr:hypothetical protein JR316_0000291 [Psilocybe cubensis]KAH9486227.1 hypothetical protein JR316_0000291 [Psilocybe cubensis]